MHELELHQPTCDAMVRYYADKGEGQAMNAARLRMATLPAGSHVLSTPKMWVPLAVCNNVHVLPGIPWMFDRMLEAQSTRFAAMGAHAGLPENAACKLATYHGGLHCCQHAMMLTRFILQELRP